MLRNPIFRSGRLALDYDHVETRGVLAGAYLPRHFDTDEPRTLTHLVFIGGAPRYEELRTGCRQPVDNMADIYSVSIAESAEPPTCATCAKKWEKIPPELRGRDEESELPLDGPTRRHLTEWLEHARGDRGSSEREESVRAIRAALRDDSELIDRNLTWDEIERMGKRLLEPNAGSERPYQLRSKTALVNGVWVSGKVLSTFATLEQAIAVGRGRYRAYRAAGDDYYPEGLIVRGPDGKVWEVRDDDREPNARSRRDQQILREIRKAAARTPPWKPSARKAYISDLALEIGMPVGELAPYLIRLNQEIPGGILSRLDLVAAADPQKLRSSTIQTGVFGGAELVDIEALSGRAPNAGYYVWLIDAHGEPLLEGPYGPHELEKAKQLARIGATEGKHDRAVSRGQKPTEKSFEIVRQYKAGSGERIL